MIIEFKDIQSVRPIAENIDDVRRIDSYIIEAERLYLLPAIGAELYKAIEADKIAHEDLFSEKFYDDNKKYTPGLKDAMAYLVYSRFLRNNNLNVTAFGVVHKNGQFSEQVDDKTIVRNANDAEKIGREYLCQCIDYLKFIGKLPSCKTLRKKTKFKTIGQ